MIDQFDVFAVAPGGQLTWQGSAATPEAAEELVHRLAKSSLHREYIIFNLKTGKKLVISADARDGDTSTNDATT